MTDTGTADPPTILPGRSHSRSWSGWTGYAFTSRFIFPHRFALPLEPLLVGRLRGWRDQAGTGRAAGLAVTLLALLLLRPAAPAGEPILVAPGESAQRRVFESAHFVMHTDLAQPRAQLTLERMEHTLKFAINCWKRSHRGKIECYLVDNLAAWPSGSLPHPLADVVVRRVGGGTVAAHQRESSRAVQRKAVIYAVSRPGVVEHEVVHAYCVQNFGATGPEWYREGMAEMAAYGESDSRGVLCPAERLAVIRRGGKRSVSDVLTVGEQTQKMVDILGATWPRRKDEASNDPLRDWTVDDDHAVQQVRDEYVWSWALCHLLNHNANFAGRFRALGEAFLTEQGTTFDEHFAPMQAELLFEYMFFLQHVDVGFRADLCAWDWKRRFRTLEETSGIGGRIYAKRGWQPSGLVVTAGKRYAFRADGSWRVNTRMEATTADGTPTGAGRLIGIVQHNYQLSAPFPLGNRGEFVAPCSGRLYLRCEDDWNRLSDNQGDVLVRLTHAEEMR